jgi:two-component sensor histidine kinase
MSYLQSLLISNHHFNDDENLEKFRFTLLNTLLIIATFFGFINLLGSYFEIIKFPAIYEKILLIYIILNVVALLYLRKDRRFYLRVVHFIIFNAFILFTSALLLSLDDSFRLIWFFILLLSYFILVSKKYGIYFMFILSAVILVIYLNYDLGFTSLTISTFFNSFFIFTGFIYYFINKIDKDAIELKHLNQTLKTKIEIETTQRIEKEVLLQEVHHRVKNNLHIILSMIQLQQNENNHTEDTSLLIDLENRINAIAKSYEMLMDNTSLQQISMKSYLEELLADMHESLSHPSHDIEFSTDINATLPLKEAVYIGLISNEIITNSYKYAFPNKKGKLHISLIQKGKSYVLTIKDDGIGFTPNKDTSSLGQKLIHTLVVEQLNGKLLLDTKNQTKYNIQFTLA